MTAAPKATTREGDDQERDGHLVPRPQLPPLSSISSDEAKLGEGEAEKGGSIEELLQDSLIYTDEQYKRVLMKQDLILLPLMWLCYGTQQADKVSVSTQSTFGLREDLNMRGQQYSWLTTIFYLSYLVSEPLVVYLLQRFAINKVLGIMMILWGIVVGAIAASQNWATTMALRALQGALESSISPAFLIVTASTWRTEEHSLRALIWGTSNAGMGIITALGMYGIGRRALSHPGGLAPWRAISLFLGPLTVVLGILAYFFIGTPREVHFLSPKEKRIAQARILDSRTGTDRIKRPWNWAQFWDTFRDPQIYIFFTITLINALPNGGTTSFGNLIYVSFGFSNLDTILRGIIPQNVLGIAWFLFVGIVTRKYRKVRFIMMMFSVLPAFIGLLCVSLLPRDPSYNWRKYGCYLMTVTGTLPGLMIWSFLPSNVTGRTKKSAVSTAIFIAYCTGNSIGAQLFRSEWAPAYRPAIAISAAFYAAEFILMAGWRQYYVRQNKQRRARIAAEGISDEEVKRRGESLAELDTVDHENPYFFYDY